MEKRKTIQMLLVAALAGGLSIMGYAQGKVCEGTAYEILELQAPSDPSAYVWWEDGKEIPNAAAAKYTVPADKPVGKYTYIRRSKKDGCDWMSSNAYTVEVMTCGAIADDASIGTKGSFQDPRDNKVYKTVKMPDGKVWFAENLNYQVDLTFNQQAGQANGVAFTSTGNGVPAIGSYWCPAVSGATLSADRNTCNVYGALYTWETAMSLDGKGVWDETRVSGNYYNTSGAPGSTPEAAVNNAVDGRGICPSGWHIPTLREWSTLLAHVDDGDDVFTNTGIGSWSGTNAGTKLKTAATFVGTDPGDGSIAFDAAYIPSDRYGFTLIPAGLRMPDQFASRATWIVHMSSTAANEHSLITVDLNSNSNQVRLSQRSRYYGFSLRCVEN
ncbi:MAG: hypothetical protein LBF39_04040 [Prevotellaceae bacterium]|jgi:uncharacterized protein (TIGR02145 family)|nr:hypothetical protein [Prevotellaceae bacterium]